MSKEIKSTPSISNDAKTMLAERFTLKGKDRIIVDFLFETYGDMADNDMMLNVSFVVFKRLYPSIKHLSSKEQKNIIHETIMIAYDSRISGFEHMLEM